MALISLITYSEEVSPTTQKDTTMLRQAKEFKSFGLRASDGDIGKANEFYFDDRHWTVRYLVAESGDWLTGKQVLISPYALSPANDTQKVIPVDLTKKQIEDCPSLSADQPVSRQYETEYFGYYGWPYYGYGPYEWGFSESIMRNPKQWKAEELRQEAWDPHLRSTAHVIGHHIQAIDGEIGHVEDFIIDDDTWSIRYLIVDTKNWWPGKHVLISPQWIERVSWEESKVFVNLSAERVQRAPEYAAETLNRSYETLLYKHYDWRGYWTNDIEAKRTKRLSKG